MIVDGKIDPTFLISHRLPLEDAPEGYKMFKEQQDEVHQGRPEARLAIGADRDEQASVPPLPSSPGASSASATSSPALPLEDGYDLLIAADEPAIVRRRRAFEARALQVETPCRSTSRPTDGVRPPCSAPSATARSTLLIANAGARPRPRLPGPGLGTARTSSTPTSPGPCYLIQPAGAAMRRARRAAGY